MGSSATTYGPCSITICKRAGQITLKSELLPHRRCFVVWFNYELAVEIIEQLGHILGQVQTSLSPHSVRR